MADSRYKMIITGINEKDAKLQEKVMMDLQDENMEVLAKLVCADETVSEVKSNGATFLAPPQPYWEKPQYQCVGNDDDPEGLTRTLGSFSSASTGSECDDDDDVTDEDSGHNWFELDTCGRVHHVLVHWIGKFIALLALLYLFICSLDFLSSAFRILGGRTAGGVFTNSQVLRNPVAGLMIGILATVLVQSSSTSSSIIVTMVASSILDVQQAIPMIMGANIGTSVTNTFVSMAQSGDRREFKRAFAAATVHDMFNWLTVLVLLPVEVFTGYLYHLTKVIVDSSNLETNTGGKLELLKAITKPFTSLVVQVDKKVISKIAEGHKEYLNRSLIKKYCVYETVDVLQNITTERNVSQSVDGITFFVMKNTTEEVIVTNKIPKEKCFCLMSQIEMNETLVGVLLLIVSLAVLCSCLILMVKLLHSILRGSIAKVIKKTLNADFPGCFHWLTGYVAMLVGALMTVLVQSSSVFTSALTPLVGIGMIKLERMYPLTLGSNIGTTGTGVLAAMAASGDKLPVALQIALCHLFFNISGIILFYPIPALRKIPIKCANFLGKVTSEYRWFAIAYIITLFLILPVGIFLLSLAGPIPSICVYSVIGPVILFVIVLKVLQKKYPDCLPKCLKTWKFLPKCLRSLQPIDNTMMRVLGCVRRCCPCCLNCCAPKKKPDTRTVIRKAGLECVFEVQKPNVINSSPNQSVASSVLLLNSRI